ncbi:hypothetical protein MmiAt1_09190 [Methanimicrococcus sp. At1]|uniref:Glycerophosphoryl diester phosphodiesterase membrane domain-containing protein n=1 Tax=Methanimicrococcus hacksteinii TaxID=3028293 RepID=A0ABU3VR22_9EURY|nr:hypothetical protein [Methanimicrococcus sp. At1]MDV0445345.1 hypothetical protein [Methanimicrococcus sp. At1]
MDFDVITSSLKKGWDAFIGNIVAYIVGLIIMIIGSILIVTAAPLMYGMYYMVLKGLRGEKVEIKDIFYGFSSVSMFIRSWIGFIVYILIIVIIGFILGFIGGAISAATGSAAVASLMSLLILIITYIIEIFVYYSLYIYVMTPSENIIYAMKESIGVGKSNILTVLITIILASIISILVITAPLGMLFAASVLKELNPGLKDASAQ